MKCRRQSCRVEAFAQPFASTLNATNSEVITAVIIKRCKASKRGGLLTGDPTDLGHAHHNGNRATQSEAVDARDQVQPLGQVTVLANICHARPELNPQKPLQTCDFAVPIALAARIATGLATGFYVSDVLRG